MSFTARALLLAMVAGTGALSAGCSDLTRPDEIVILAEPPPAPKAPTGAELAEREQAENAALAKPGFAAKGRPKAQKAGGG